jgi:hypothetical protein
MISAAVHLIWRHLIWHKPQYKYTWCVWKLPFWCFFWGGWSCLPVLLQVFLQVCLPSSSSVESTAQR